MKHARCTMAAAMLAFLAGGGAMADGLPEKPVLVPVAVEPFADFQVKVGVTGVLWQDSNKGILSSALGPLFGASAHVDDVVIPSLTLTYFLSRNIAAELFCCFAHANVYGTGTLRALAQDKIADAWAFPPALTAQYRFDPIGAIRPYIGVGVQWIHYFDSDSDLRASLRGYDSVKFRDSWGPVVQAGFDYDLGRGWSVGFDAKYAWQDTRITWRDGLGDSIVTKHDLDPLIITANVGYRFSLDDLFGRTGYVVPLK